MQDRTGDDGAGADFAVVADRFADLWQAILASGGAAGPADQRSLMIDMVRDALDRGAARLNVSPPASPPEIVANTFALEARIAQSPRATLLRIRHRDLGTLHVLKQAGPEADRAAHDAIRREARIGMALRHPHVVETQMLLRLADGRPALLMTWYPTSLADWLQSSAPTVPQVMAVVRAVLSGLGHIHRHGFVHGDLSPANLLFDGEDLKTIAIADFGIAVETRSAQTALGIAFAGQPAFAAPEQLAGQALDGRTDLHALGRLIGLLLQHGADPRPQDKQLHARLEALASRLSAADADARPETAKAAERSLDGF